MRHLRVQRAGWSRYFLVWYDPERRRLTKATNREFRRAREATAFAIDQNLGFAILLKKGETDVAD